MGIRERSWEKPAGWEVQPSKTVWDWLQLLIVPAMLVAVAVGYNAEASSREHHREDHRIKEDRALARSGQEDATLLSYFTQMDDLMLNGKVVLSEPPSASAAVALNLTRAVIRRVHGRRRAEVLLFLKTAGLWPSLVDRGLTNLGIDLRGLDFSDTVLRDLSLKDVDLRDARFDGATLIRVDFTGADLRGTSFRKANLITVDFTLTNLRRAVFDRAVIGPPKEYRYRLTTSFQSACLSTTSFVKTRFGRTEFLFAAGHTVDFSHAQGLTSLENVESAGLSDVRFDGVPSESQPKLDRHTHARTGLWAICNLRLHWRASAPLPRPAPA